MMTLRELWRRVIGEKAPDRVEILLSQMIQNNKETQEAMFNAVAQMSEASAKQAEVLNSYVKLFDTAGEPGRWTRDVQKENLDDLVSQGYPVDASEKEQADWVLRHMDEL